MVLFQMLDCNVDLGTCCSDPGLVSILDITRKVMSLFQIIIPILLIVGATYSFVKLALNPEIKNGTKAIVNQFLAAVLCFFIPVIVSFALGLVPDTFELGSCWKQAEEANELARSSGNTYIEIEEGKSGAILISPGDYDVKPAPSSTGSGDGSATGKAIVEYAKSFVGQRYLYSGTWNGERPYTATDCSGFVQGVFRHFGINLARDTKSQWTDTSSYTLVPNGSPIKAGDLVMYDGHVAILTGNGNEIVHAKGSSYGVTTDADYKNASRKTILGIMRIKGVN